MFRLGALLREPLVHFCLLGGAFFWLAGGITPEDSEIVVNSSLKRALAADYERKHGLAPSGEQLGGLVATWIEDEMFYREALRVGLDQSDPVMRRRLIQSMKFLAEDEAGSTDATQEQLQTVLDKNPEAFQIKPTVSFEHVYFQKGNDDDSQVSAALKALQSGSSMPRGNPFIHGSEFDGLVRARIKTLFGESFADSVFKLEQNTWVGPIRSSFGQHLVRVGAVTESRTPKLEEVANQVLGLWRQQARDRALATRLEQLRANYDVVVQESATP